MKFLKTYIFFFFVLISNISISQNIHDFRSVNSGDWNDVNNWEYYNGTSWVAAPYYPGNGATNDVTIIGGNTINLNVSPPQNINSITVGDGDRNNKAILHIATSSTLKTTSFTIAYDGYVTWENVALTFPDSDTDIYIESNDSGYGLEIAKPCSASKSIYLGSVKYAICNENSNSADYSFSDLNNNGGSLTVSPTSNSPICLGDTVFLSANPSGPGTKNFSWNLIASPNSDTYTSTSENPNNYIPSLSGDYTFEVTVTNENGNTDTKTIVVTVNTSPSPPISSGNISECAASPIQTLDANDAITSAGTITWYDAMTGGNVVSNPTLATEDTITYYAEYSDGTCTSTRTPVTLTINSLPIAPTGDTEQKFCSANNPTVANLTAAGTNIQWYTSTTGGTALANTTPLTTNTYYASQSDTNCESSDRLAVNVIISGCRVITNRRITYRVKK
ncbi:hypothetical protein C8N26_1962 [Tenacibaculum lutimaris]|uniref:Ig-like domain-containing protein n=1 Tax=Tenacibaculum lutimaris TaxID=285258 RepID=A0A420E0Y6_9FLAO|nr:PKD domain-containing protein [Tenacibaculum lutimaris]RKF03573.1 hypothetical protein C8N26_1962 [Tenacibaculum lutimaris]